MKKLVIDQGSGRLGNQMMQLMTAKIMARALPDFEVFGYDMPDWRLSRPLTQGHPYCPLVLRGVLAPFELALRFSRLRLVNAILLRAIRVDYRWFLPREEAKALFQPLPEDDAPGFDETHIVINIRGQEILFGKSGDYGPISIEYYKHILRETGLKPVFMGQIFDDYYGNMIRSAFPDAVYVQHTSAIKDFQIIRNSKNIVVSLSTFSWLAAWLSEAQRIYMPLIGGWNPEQRPDSNLTPADDRRFLYDLFPVRIWKATPEQIASLNHDRAFRRVTAAEVEDIRSRSGRKLLPKRIRKSVQLFFYLVLHLACRRIG
ncbi:hypothetical protein [Pleomorphomonas koreensis]|uniref:hypothetical protein n=1 Tax=Pleomorphomonas koreensis TaxID=257440 RepID=UPI000416391A|nr:hypothetical protein [Pleomorphomonas koreensis]